MQRIMDEYETGITKGRVAGSSAEEATADAFGAACQSNQRLKLSIVEMYYP